MKKLLAIALVGATIFASTGAEARDRDRADRGRGHEVHKHYGYGKHYGHKKVVHKYHYSQPRRVVYRNHYPRYYSHYDRYYYPANSLYLGFKF